MPKEDKEKIEQEKLKKAYDHLQGEATKLTNEFLPRLIEADLPFIEIHDVFTRMQEILKDKLEAMSFEDAKINDARRNRLFESLMQFSEVKVKPAPQKKGKASQERAKRVEPLARELVDKIVCPNQIFSNGEHLDDIIANEDQVLLWTLARQYLDLIYDNFLTLVKINEEAANKIKWGKDREEITWKDFDNTLTRGPKNFVHNSKDHGSETT